MEGTAVGDSQLEVGVQLVAGKEGTVAGQGMALEEGMVAGQGIALEEGAVVGVGKRVVAGDSNQQVHREVGHPVACSRDPEQDRLPELQPGLLRQ